MNYVLAIFVDVGVLLASFWGAYALRNSFLSPIQEISFYLPVVVASVLLLWFSMSLFRIYQRTHVLFSLSYLVDYLRSMALWSALLFTFAYFAKAEYSRLLMIFYIASAIVLLTIARLLILRLRPSVVAKYAELLGVLADVVKISKYSPDTLTLLEGLNSKRSSSVFYPFIKRVLDISVSLAGLLVCVPFLPVVVFFIKRDSEGSAIITQERVGKDGRKFTLYKLRTMKSDTELYAPAPMSDADARVTRAGAFLRKYSLDELPQLWNVLRGDMSLVGPRPEMPFIVSKYSTWERTRLKVKPGLTGLWQILGRKDVPLQQNLQYDFYYVFNSSFFLDLAIILRTIPHLLFPKGAY